MIITTKKTFLENTERYLDEAAFGEAVRIILPNGIELTLSGEEE